MPRKTNQQIIDEALQRNNRTDRLLAMIYLVVEDIRTYDLNRNNKCIEELTDHLSDKTPHLHNGVPE